MTSWIREELDRRFAYASYRSYKAFARPQQAAATDVLEQLGWRVWEDDEDIDDEIIAQAKSDCGQEPTDTTLVLIANDGDYMKLVTDLQTQSVQVYLITSQDMYNKELVEKVSRKLWIQLPNHL